MNRSSSRCPVCGEAFGPLTLTRTVTVWKRITSDERVLVVVATCAACGSEYERSSRSAKAQAIPLPSGGPVVLGIILGTLLLSIINGVLSLELSSVAGVEVNPVLCFYQELGVIPFILVKYGLTFAPLLMLFLFQDKFFFGRIQGKQLLMAAPIPYLAATAYSLLQFEGAVSLFNIAVATLAF